MGFASYAVSREFGYARNLPPTASPQPGFTPVVPTSTIDASQPMAATPDFATVPPMPSPTPEPEPTLIPWDGKERVTILLMGLDYRDWSNETGPSRSDTMILLSLDPVTNTGGILSIPRDLWVAIPGYGHGKINTAHAVGGPTLAVRTVELVIGVPVHYYAVIDFDAFVRFIDEMGGLKLDIPERIKIDPLGDNNTRYLQPGVQTLPGELVLAYARNRSHGDGDFDRARRQQQVIIGIRDRILDLELLPVLIPKAPVLYQELASGIRTNMQLDEAIQLAVLASKVPDGGIRQGVIDTQYVAYGWSPDNLSILVPYPDRIRVLRDEIFATSGSLAPLAPGNEQERMILEVASVAILNGSSDSDLARRTSNYLTGLGVNIVSVNTSERYSSTTLIDHVGRPYTMRYLSSLFGVDTRFIEFDYDFASSVDVVIILGDDWAMSNPMP